MLTAIILRSLVATAGVALLASAVAPARSRHPGPGQRHRPLGAAFSSSAATAIGLLAPLARRSAVLRRAAAAATTRQRLALAGQASWVATACVLVAARGRGDRRSSSGAALSGGDALLDALAGLRVATGLVALAGCLLLIPLVGPSAVALALPAAAGAAFLPDVALGGHARRAAAAAEAAMPEALESLAACCRAGLPLEAALEVTALHTPQPVQGVLNRSRRRQAAGQNPATALRVEAELVGIDEVVALGRLVDRHHQLGLPLETPLLTRADAARARAHTAALRCAGRGIPMASLITAMVVAPCCVGMLALWVISATIAQSGAL